MVYRFVHFDKFCVASYTKASDASSVGLTVSQIFCGIGYFIYLNYTVKLVLLISSHVNYCKKYLC